jgi:predicted DNA-binding transcriptional regulator AlpA
MGGSEVVSNVVSISEIAALAGRPKQTVLHWTNREYFPEPVGELAVGRVWNRSDVVKWMETNDLPMTDD